jgi:DNA-directed RNA polymerase specialized sigma24 family protein
MNQDDHSAANLHAGAPVAEAFPMTRWSLVEKVRQGGPEARRAQEELCALYWYPIYAFLRRQGSAREDAQDLTQGFFAKVLADETIEAADRTKGKLRTFLLQVLKRHMVDERRRENAVKRGGRERIVSFDAMNAEERYAREPVDTRDPEAVFTRAWAGELIAGVRHRLRDEFQESGRGDVFETLLPFLLWENEPPSYNTVATKLKASEASVRLLVFRLRTKFREQLRREISHTVETPEEVDGEIAWLQSVLAA